jgi:5-methylcytosine-specific restriction protein B
MNSADRSIAFVDYALRRRFYFIDFYPDTENQDILKKWFIKNRIKESYQNNVLELMREINTEISNKLGREYQIGYSYFMDNLDYQKVKRIIDYAIIPMIEQYFFGKRNVDVIRNICNNYLIRLQDLVGEKKSLSGF